MESFVDLSYRGLSLGRRVKLTDVRPTTGYLETPAPMPVGTAIAIATDDGHAIEAIVTSIHEQVAGSEQHPGMTVAPKLDGAFAAWWKERVQLPDAPPAMDAQQNEGRTVAMPAMADPDAGDEATRLDAPIVPAAPILPGESARISQPMHAVVDDGKSTTIMDAVDPAALGLEVPGESTDADADDEPDSRKSSPNLAGSVKKRRKKNR